MNQTKREKPDPRKVAAVAAYLGVDLPKRQPAQPQEEESGGLVDAYGAPVAIRFKEERFEHFVVEHADRGDDVIYHFWPINDGEKFIDGFAKFLEEGFKSTLPSHADVRAEFISREEAAVMAKHKTEEVRLDTEARSLREDIPWIPRETYYVRVIGGKHYPLADIFLKRRVFENIESAIRAGKRN